MTEYNHCFPEKMKIQTGFIFTKLNVKTYLLSSLSNMKSKPLMQKEG